MIKKNLYFFIPFALALMVGAYLLFTVEKGTFVLYFATERKPVIDRIFVYITQLGEPLAYGIITLAFLRIKIRYGVTIIVLGAVNLVISLALKTLFAMPRPGYVYWLQNELEMISYIPYIDTNVSPTSSFPSGHTLSAFALYALVAFLLQQKKWGLPLLVIALLVGISRVVLTQHFLMDIYAGAICGVLIAMGVYALQSHEYFNNFNNKKYP